MNGEPDLFAQPKVEAPARENNPKPRKDLRDEARAWILSHPRTMHFLSYFAKQMVEKKQPFGMKLLVERVRWEHKIEGGGDGFKVNNNHTAYIARWLIQMIPEAEGLLKFRKARY